MINEYKSLLYSVAFSQDLDFLTKFMTVVINLLILVEFTYLLLPSGLKKKVQDLDLQPGHTLSASGASAFASLVGLGLTKL